MISTLAAIAVWLSAALGAVRAPATSDALKLRAVAPEAASVQLPAVRQVVVESSTPTRAEHRAPNTGLGIDRSGEIPLGATPPKHSRSATFARQHVPPRRLAFRYDATAPPSVL